MASMRNCIVCKRYPSPGETIHLCSTCQCACYCGPSCQRKDWKNHKLPCKVYCEERFKIVEALAKTDNLNSAAAQYDLGLFYAKGLGVAADASQAVNWYRRAAEAGQANAQRNLGGCYRDGIGVEADATQAVAWYRRAADAGYCGAQCNLGGCYKDGTGVKPDPTQAVAWYRRAAEAGLADAQHSLGHCYQGRALV